MIELAKSKVFAGSQFIFVKPEQNKSMKMILREEDDTGKFKEKTIKISEPAIISRYRKHVKLDDDYDFAPLFLSDYKLLTVVTDQKIYKPGDSVRFFAFGCKEGKKTANLEIYKNGRLLLCEEIKFDASGAYSDLLENLEDGAYKLAIKIGENEASCEFTVAEFSMSFLRVTLVSHSYEREELKYDISVNAGDMPYSGKLSAGLFCGYCDIIVGSAEIQADGGKASGKFTLQGHTGPFSLIFTTPGGDSASAPIPGSKADVRERARLSEMGEIIEGGILPFDASSDRVRGIYLGSTGVSTNPLVIDSLVGESTVIRVGADFEKLLLAFFEPSTGKYHEEERRYVKRGENIEIRIPHPMTIMMAGGIGKDCFETYALLIRPENLDLKITAPEKVKPGSEIEFSVRSRRQGKLMLIVADSRLEREDPFDRLTEQLFKNIKGNLSPLSSGSIKEYEIPRSEGLVGRQFAFPIGGMPTRGGGLPSGMMLSAAPPPPMVMPAAEMSFTGAVPVDIPDAMPMKSAAEPEAEAPLEAPPTTTRLDFPRIILSEMADFFGTLTKRLKLGDQIGAFSIFAFLIDGEDYTSTKASVETSQEMYAELDTPALMSPGDEITGKVLAKYPGEGALTIRTSLETVEEKVKNFGSFEIILKSAGEVMAQVDGQAGSDVTSKIITIPGRETVTVSELRWLKPGESAEGEKVVAYPNIGWLIKDSVEALVQYPFGCAEQTSAKLFGLATAYRAMKSGKISNGNTKVHRLLTQGVERMNIFYRNGNFSLWEGGEPQQHVTRQVLKNLTPLRDMEILNVREMINGSVESLIKQKISDNSLVPYSKKFAADLKTIRDAAALYTSGVKRKEAVKMVRESAVVEGDIARWKDSNCWGGQLEATCLALQVIRSEDKPLFEKGFRFISGNIQNGRLYSTADTCTFLELLSMMEADSSGAKVVLDEKETVLTKPVAGKKIEALAPVLVRIDKEQEVDYLSPRADFSGEVKIERTSLSLGEKVELAIIPREETIAPLARIYLPGNVAALKYGASVQKMYLPVEGRELKLEIYGIRKGKGKLRVALFDMYNADKVGVLPGLTINVGK